MSANPTSTLNVRQALSFSLAAIVCFHVAYTPAQSGVLAFAIVGYVIGLVQLARMATTRQCFYVSFATGFACFAPQLAFFWGLFGAFAIALWAILALWVVGFVVLVHLAIRHLGPARAAFLTPFFWTGLEYFRSELYYLKFSWLNVGYAFAESAFVPWRFVGVYGIGFLAAIPGAALLIVRREHLRRPKPIEALVIIGIAVLLVSFRIGGLVRAVEKPSLIVAGLQTEFPDQDEIPGMLDKLVMDFQSGLQTTLPFQSRSNFNLVVLPEYTLDGEPPEALKDWCRTNQKFLIVGGKDASPGTNYYNTAFVISTNGEVVFKQVKSVPIQFFADGLPAPEQKVWNSPWGKIGIGICYDLSYTRVTDALVRQGAQMLIVPTMDVAEWGQHQHELHARIAPVRAAEYGIPIFRVASSGISQGVERSGRVQTSAPFPGAGELIYFGANLGRRGDVPADRLLATLCVGITVIFVLRTAVSVLFRSRLER